MTAIDDVFAANARRTAPTRDLAAPPARRLAVLTCMDVRIDPLEAFGLSLGEAHVLRNAGGLVTDDVLRSLVLSQRALGTREVLVVQHTRCGVSGLDDAALADELEQEAGARPSFAFGGFDDLDESVRSSLERIRSCPFLPATDQVRGAVYDVDSGTVREVV